MYSGSNDGGDPVLPADKNLHATVPPALLARIEQAAESEHMTLDEFVTGIIERGLRQSGLDDVLAYGRRRARERGLEPSDVETAIAETRARDNERAR